jgi:hypothetical protein
MIDSAGEIPLFRRRQSVRRAQAIQCGPHARNSIGRRLHGQASERWSVRSLLETIPAKLETGGTKSKRVRDKKDVFIYLFTTLRSTLPSCPPPPSQYTHRRRTHLHVLEEFYRSEECPIKKRESHCKAQWVPADALRHKKCLPTSAPARRQRCQIFLGTTYQNGKNMPNYH